MAVVEPTNFINLARRRLGEEWNAVQNSEENSENEPVLPDSVADAIQRSINSPILTYRYVLPTQILAVAVEPSLDCRSIQASCGLAGAFDARSLCHGVIVEFDRQNDNVLGGSKEPYLNNPLRIPCVTEPYRKAQKNKSGFDDLCVVLDFAHASPDLASGLLTAVLMAVRKRLLTVTIVYPTPNRVSFKQAKAIVDAFLDEKSGGVRLQALGVALFRAVGARFNLFSSIHVCNVNAADSSTGNIADLECMDGAGNIVMAVEVKDRQLTLRQTQDKLPSMRNKGVRELLFLIQGGVVSDDRTSVDELIDHEFITGQNVYACEFTNFLESCLILFGESGRRIFLQHVGEELDSQRADLSHRKKWRALLQEM